MRKRRSCGGALENNAASPVIVVVGAGAIGGFVGGVLAARGNDVQFLTRAGSAVQLRQAGLHLTDFAGLDLTLRPDEIVVSDDPAVLAKADVILVCVKTAATAQVAETIAAHAARNASVISLQNGMHGVRTLRALLPNRTVLAGMVPFNVVHRAPGRLHRATSGDIVIGPTGAELAATLSVDGLPIRHSAQVEAVQWGKLLINLGNAINALSGLTLHAQLLDRDWRRLLADQMDEALTVLRAHGLPVKSMTPLPAGWVPAVLRLPTPLFRRIAAKMLTIDPSAKSSMAQDLTAGKPVEVDALQGEIIALAAEKGIAVPLNKAISTAIKAAENGGPHPLRPADLRA